MNKLSILILAAVTLLGACTPGARPTSNPTQALQQSTLKALKTLTPFQAIASTRTSTVTPVPATSTPTVTLTATITLTPTPAYPLEGRGPSNFGAGIDPLTGLAVTDPAILDRRPVLVKVENLPREHRPQWGLSLADLVFEYYTEQGTTRFASLFYGQDAKMVAPIRSGRFFDINVVQMYKSVLVFGSAYTDVLNRFLASDFAKRLVFETTTSCPSVCRYDPGGLDLLYTDTGALQDHLKTIGMDNTRQNEDGMFFQLQVPAGGDAASQVFVRFSGAIYNRWDYDPLSKRYLRFEETQNDLTHTNEVYAQLTDRLTSQPIVADTVVLFCAPYKVYKRTADSEVFEVPMDPASPAYVSCDGKSYPAGTGPAWVARDGKLYQVTYQRKTRDSVLTLVNSDGSLFPFKPGQTWFEVLSQISTVEKKDNGVWRFTFGIP